MQLIKLLYSKTNGQASWCWSYIVVSQDTAAECFQGFPILSLSARGCLAILLDGLDVLVPLKGGDGIVSHFNAVSTLGRSS